MSVYFPFMIDLSDKTVLIVGGGNAAFHKVRVLSEFAVSVRLISPQICDKIKHIVLSDRNIKFEKRQFEESDIETADIVIAATDDKELNRKIVTLSRSKKKLSNAVDDAEYCDFIFPSVLKRDGFTVSVCTDGKSPLLARHLKEKINTSFGSEYDNLANYLGSIREQMKAEITDPEEKIKLYEEIIKRYEKQSISDRNKRQSAGIDSDRND